MAEYIYEFDIASDFPRGKVNSSRLEHEIFYAKLNGHNAWQRPFTGQIDVSQEGDSGTVKIYFQIDDDETAPPQEDQDQMDVIIENHSGDPLTQTVQVETDDAKEADGRRVVTTSPVPSNWTTWVTGASDDIDAVNPTGARGSGAPILLEWDGEEPELDVNHEVPHSEKTVDIQFREPVQVHDGEVCWYDGHAKTTNNWFSDDNFDFLAAIPANTPVPAPGMDGNVNMVEVPGSQGTMHVIVPAAGNGAHNLPDLATSTAPATARDENGNPNGYWDVNEYTGEVFPAVPGQGTHNLYDFALKVYIIRKMPMGNPQGCFALDSYKVEWVHPNWKLQLTVRKKRPGAGTVQGWLLAFRQQTT
jgi:hypothetical protein